jgi:threonine dehydratase
VPDRPARIVDLAAIAASQKANILDIHHGRTFTSAAFRETEIELMVETRGPEAVEALLRTMAERISGAAFQVRVARQTTRLAQS